MQQLIHTCYRVFDVEESISFYEKLGLKVLRRLPICASAMNLFMGLQDDGPRLELTYNFDQQEPYEIGTGFGHIAFTVSDIDGTLEQLAAFGIDPEKPPYTVSAGGSRLCFVRDPDGYRIELIERDPGTD